MKTMNVARHPDRFQVDTGPLLAPDFVSGAARPSGRLMGLGNPAPGRGVPSSASRWPTWSTTASTGPKLILSPPGAVVSAGNAGGAPATTDYSEVQILSARNTLHCALP